MGLSIVIAPDSFKGSLSAGKVAQAIAEGWHEARPGDDIRMIPQADGGEGTLNAIDAAVAGAVRHPVGLVIGPDSRPTPASWLELPVGIAVVELAEPSGLPLMAAPDALGATTRGLGEVIRHALESGVHSLVITLGGSASTDGGTGAVQALGMRMLRADGVELSPGGGALAHLATIDRRDMLGPPPGGVTLLTDVTAPLLGPSGAAAVFGPQKGASVEDVRVLEAGLQQLVTVLGGDPTLPGSGAAGGTAYGFVTAWGAAIEPGAAYIARLTGLTTVIAAADVVLTGEGRFDSTSLSGKVVGEVLRLAAGARTGVITGSLGEAPPAGTWSAALVELAGSAAAAMAEPEYWLRQAGRAAAHHFA